MKTPDPARLFKALDKTWSPASITTNGPWTLRKGNGGGQRVSAATANSPVLETDISAAETGMRDLGQRPLFMIRPEDESLDQWLDDRKYSIHDPVNIFLIAAADLAEDLPMTLAIPTWPMLAVQKELWRNAGIGPERLAVMERVTAPKVSILGRRSDTPGGTAFVSVDGDIAMLHALEIAQDQRRKGVAQTIMKGAANWAVQNRANWLAVAVTRANASANALYDKLGMSVATRYHYRHAPEETA